LLRSIEHAKTRKIGIHGIILTGELNGMLQYHDDDKYPNTELLEYKSEGEDNWLVYKYETAWSPAVTILELNYLIMVPNSLLTLEYEEEQGWGGEIEIV
jgi:hypothetical protein